jgi:hypothetical protein
MPSAHLQHQLDRQLRLSSPDLPEDERHHEIGRPGCRICSASDSERFSIAPEDQILNSQWTAKLLRYLGVREEVFAVHTAA